MVKVTTERLPDAQVVLNIEVEPEAVVKATDRAFQSIAQRVRVPGFRPGKAPRAMVERMIGGPDVVRQEGIEKLIPQIYREAVAESGVEPIDQPEFEITSVDPLVVKATISVKPTVTLGDYKSVRIPLLAVEVPYERINETIERIRDQQTTWAPVDRPAKIGDRQSADVEATLSTGSGLVDAAGQPMWPSDAGDSILSNSKAQIEVDPTDRWPAPGFHEQVVGLAKGDEKRFLLTLPEDYFKEEHRGKSAIFQVKVHEVLESNVPALNDEFAKSVSEFETFDALRDDIRRGLQSQMEQESRRSYQDSVLKEIVALSTFEIPPAMIRRELDRMLHNFGHMLEQQRVTLDQYVKLTGKSADDLREEFRPQAEGTLRSFLALREIAERESIVVGPEDIGTEVGRMLATVTDPKRLQAARTQLAQPSQLAEIEATLWERRIVEFLVANAQQAIDASTAAAAESTSETSESSEPEDSTELDADSEVEPSLASEASPDAEIKQPMASESSPDAEAKPSEAGKLSPAKDVPAPDKE